jgi:Zn-dependent metalloprotease
MDPVEEQKEKKELKENTLSLKKNKRLFIILGIIVLISAIALIVVFQLTYRQVSAYSTFRINNGVGNILLNSEKGYLYKTKQKGLMGVKDFLKENPKYGNQTLLPENFYNNSDFQKEVKDIKTNSIKVNPDLNGEHYFFGQEINKIPLYGAQLLVHVKNNNEIYSISGNLAYKTNTTKELISTDRAQKIAINQASQDAGFPQKIEVAGLKKYVLNKKVLGIGDDSTNFLVLAVLIKAGEPANFLSEYFVDLENEKIVYVESRIKEALSRKINNCSGGCALARAEGAAAVGDSDVNTVYDNFGTVYSYYNTDFQRDSFDGNGATLIGNVHYPMEGTNAYWNGSQMMFSTGLTTLDVTAHELTHAVTERTANLVYEYQSGAMNESVSDIFASNIDGNWSIGEGSPVGVIRDMSYPGRYPDKVFASNYKCYSGDPVEANDYGGVHSNSTVVSKAYYLMTDGGSFNNCQITGIGRQIAGAIVYRALTSYLSRSSNFKSFYSAALQSCNDLYGADSGNCAEVKKAMQATELDQQPDGEQRGAICIGQQEKTPECAGGTTTSNSGTTSTTSQGTSTTTITTTTTKPLLKKIMGTVFVDTNGNKQQDSGEVGYQGAQFQLLGATDSQTATTDSNGKFEMNNLPAIVYSSFMLLSPVRKDWGQVDLTPIDIAGREFTIALTQAIIDNPTDDPPIDPQDKTIPTTTTTTSSTSTTIPGGTTTTTTQPGGTTTTTRSGGTSTTTTTAPVLYNCVVDSSCASDKNTIQFCPLRCTKK